MGIFTGIFNFITSCVKIIEEQSQVNTIASIDRNENGFVVFEIMPLNGENSCKLTAVDILKSKALSGQLRKTDIKLIKAVAYAEGDLFIKEKDYEEENEIFHLYSILTGEEDRVTREQLLSDKDVINGLNKVYRKSKHLLD